jgi:hypothetical protein
VSDFACRRSVIWRRRFGPLRHSAPGATGAACRRPACACCDPMIAPEAVRGLEVSRMSGSVSSSTAVPAVEPDGPPAAPWRQPRGWASFASRSPFRPNPIWACRWSNCWPSIRAPACARAGRRRSARRHSGLDIKPYLPFRRQRSGTHALASLPARRGTTGRRIQCVRRWRSCAACSVALAGSGGNCCARCWHRIRVRRTRRSAATVTAFVSTIWKSNGVVRRRVAIVEAVLGPQDEVSS